MGTWQDYYIRRDQDGSWVKWPDETVIRSVYRVKGARGGNTSGVRALDLGCGSGRHTTFMASEGFDVWAADASDKAVEITNRLLSHLGKPEAATLVNLTDLPFEDNFFDLIVCWHVLYVETLGNIRKGISEIFRVLKPGGALCTSLRRDNDYTFGKGTKLEENTYKLDPSQVNEDPGDMVVHYSPLDEVKELFEKFSSVEIGFSDFAFGNLDEVRAHWTITAKKPE